MPLNDNELAIAMSGLSPAGRSILRKISRGEAITAADSRRLCDDLRRQGATGRAAPELSEAGEMWARVHARAGRLKPDVAAELGEEHQQHQSNRRTSGKGVEMWKRAYASTGRLKREYQE